MWISLTIEMMSEGATFVKVLKVSGQGSRFNKNKERKYTFTDEAVRELSEVCGMMWSKTLFYFIMFQYSEASNADYEENHKYDSFNSGLLAKSFTKVIRCVSSKQ